MSKEQNVEAAAPSQTTPSFNPSWRFYAIFGALCLVSFISSVDATIVTTALPTIVAAIGGQQDYVWIANCFVFASTVPQPLFAQISNIFGRRQPMLVAIAFFTLGSGIAGGAHSPAMLIAGRTVQGIGTGGIFVLLDVIVCDLVPLRQRGMYLGLLLGTAAIATTIGPIVGGALAVANWRWIFYLNLPVSGVALVCVVLFLNVNYKANPTWKHALMRVDFLGNLIFIPSVLAILLALVLGGVQFPWGSWHIILPLVLGVAGWAAFHVHQASPICREPSMPPQVFKNRTSAIGLALAFLGNMLLQNIAYFMPVYFQAALGTSPLTAGVNFLPFTVAVVPAGIATGVVMSKTGSYRPLHWLGFALNAVGAGLLSLLDQSSSKAAWAGFLIVCALGNGICLTAVLPAVLAALPESLVATATGVFSFLRSFAYTWGVTIPSIILNAQFARHAHRIQDPQVRDTLAAGASYGYVGAAYLDTLAPDTRAQVIEVFALALRAIWYSSAAFSALGFVLALFEKHHPLRNELNTEFDIKEGAADSRGGGHSRDNAGDGQPI